MRRLLAALALLGGAVVGVVALGASGGSAAPPSTGSGQSDSARFVLLFPGPPEHTASYIGQVVYCGVDEQSEPFRFDLVATAPPNPVDPADPTQGYETGHDRSGWLDVKLQDSIGLEGQEKYRVPTNDSFSFGLTLGARPGADQMVRVTSEALGDPDGGGMPFRGVVSVLANPRATDPFDGDNRTDNFCVTIGPSSGGPPVTSELPQAEYVEGEISTALPVPDDWVVDGDGSDGGDLAGVPH